jgi:hypothetical protein
MPRGKAFAERPTGTGGLVLQQVANKVSARLWFRHARALNSLLCFSMWMARSYLKSQRAG